MTCCLARHTHTGRLKERWVTSVAPMRSGCLWYCHQCYHNVVINVIIIKASLHATLATYTYSPSKLKKKSIFIFKLRPMIFYNSNLYMSEESRKLCYIHEMYFHTISSCAFKTENKLYFGNGILILFSTEVK